MRLKMKNTLVCLMRNNGARNMRLKYFKRKNMKN